MSVIAGVFGALPPHRYSQRELTETFVNIPDFEATKNSSGSYTQTQRSTAGIWCCRWRRTPS